MGCVSVDAVAVGRVVAIDSDGVVVVYSGIVFVVIVVVVCDGVVVVSCDIIDAGGYVVACDVVGRRGDSGGVCDDGVIAVVGVDVARTVVDMTIVACVVNITADGVVC